MFSLLKARENSPQELRAYERDLLKAYLFEHGLGKDVWSLGVTLLEVICWAFDAPIPDKFYPRAHYGALSLAGMAENFELHRQLIEFIDQLEIKETSRMSDRQNFAEDDLQLIKVSLKSMLKFNPERRLASQKIWQRWLELSSPNTHVGMDKN